MEHPANQPTRRAVLRGLGLGAAAMGAVPLLSACGSGLKGSGSSSGSTIKIGYVSPRTGAYAAFAESDAYLLKQARDFFAKGITHNGKKYEVEILDRDTGSDPQQASTVADELISQERVDLILVTATPETVHPVADKCESEGVPCVSTIEPWQAYFFGRGGSAKKTFTYTFHFFDGIEHLATVESDMWRLFDTNKKVGVLWPNDSDGNAFRDKATGYRAQAATKGFTFVDPGSYEGGTKDFSSVIATFKKEGVEILAGVPTPPDFATFWTQAAQQGFRPKVATISKAILFESSVASLPNGLGDGLCTASWWVPQFPFTSTLTGQTATQLAADYEKSPLSKGRSWNQGLGPNHALFEVANHVLRNADPKNREAVAAQIGRTTLDTVLGHLSWTGGGKGNPVKNVATIPMVGTQWVKGGGKTYDLDVVSNTLLPQVKLDGKAKAL
ncbi:ABC transporter substrate-binding protein [Streptomyces griseiscabiei]|uniref:ABC transporter substrate-binding protein n=1 Tax=Streptomyces griseiscabiei TaxID=2993540 RepID=A0ABU4L3S9_9ACTN|nr:ABC transporter substrate-binding protein [Streptomyces griseiscabiei]MBZ3905270.1 ABC transporter substrate-binding protein [Streptomyces griseiscabiei]MDX2910356.1 ABC transporter substrate-binding protein [Streptomyces griseiscabiei]